MIRAALALHEATGEPRLSRARAAWQGTLDRHYANPDTGGYFLTADDAEGLVVRPSATTDDATPNPNALAAQNLVRLAALCRPARLARPGRPAVRRHPRRARPRTCSATWRCSTRSICACAPPRSWSPGRGPRADRFARRRAAAAVPRPHRAARTVRRRAAADASGAGQDRGRVGSRRLRLRRRDAARCR